MKLEDIQQLLKKETFSADDKVLINKWKQDYPYFSMFHWLSDKVEGKITVSALHKTDLFKYASFFGNKSQDQGEIASAIEIPNEKVMPLSEKMEPEPKNEIVSPVENKTEDVVEMKEIIEHQIEPTDDIMNLINEVPLDAPIQLDGLVHEKVKVEEGEESKMTSNEDLDEKSLMVMMSFTEWLHYFKSKRQKEEEEEQDKKALRSAWQKEKLTAAIEEENDIIPEPIFKQVMDSISSEAGIVSESLAKVLASQGKKDKAIEMYRKLSLQNPDKNAYFADLINKLKSEH